MRGQPLWRCLSGEPGGTQEQARQRSRDRKAGKAPGSKGPNLQGKTTLTHSKKLSHMTR